MAPSSSSLLSISLFYLLIQYHQIGAVTEFGDFDTLTNEATLLGPIFYYWGYHAFYPSMNFSCSGSITEVSFLTRNHQRNVTGTDNEEPIARFSTWTLSSESNGSGHFVMNDYADSHQSDNVNATGRIQLHELILNSSSAGIRFDAGDVFGIRLPRSFFSPLHQRVGGFNLYMPITEENYNATEFNISFQNTADNIPLVSIESDNPTCVRGFLTRESLNKFFKTNMTENDISEYLHDSISHQLIIPDMIFNQSGFLKKWTFVGIFNAIIPTGLLAFQVWRRNGSGYHLVNETSVEPRPTGYLNVYEVVLPESPPVVVEAGDVVGVYLPRKWSRYILAYVRDSEGYQFMEFDDDTGELIAADCDIVNCRGRPLVIADIAQEATESNTEGTTLEIDGGGGGNKTSEPFTDRSVTASDDGDGVIIISSTSTQVEDGGIPTQSTSSAPGTERSPAPGNTVLIAVAAVLLLLMAIVISVVLVIIVVIYWKRRTGKNESAYVNTLHTNPAYGLQATSRSAIPPVHVYETPDVPLVYDSPLAIDVNSTTGFPTAQNQETSDVYSGDHDGDHEYDYVESVNNKPQNEVAMTTNICYHERFHPSADRVSVL